VSVKSINRKQLSITLFVIGAIFFGCAVELSIYFSKVRPTVPNPSNGFTHPLANHGTVVYLTSGEYWLHLGCLFGGLPLLILGVWLGRPRR
jgi:hypothetical protein